MSEEDDSNGARAEVLRRLGANEQQVSEILAYTENHFHPERLNYPISLPLPDEDFVSVWRRYYDEAQTRGVVETLRAYLPQLAFPVAAGMSENENYRAATRRGNPTEYMPEATGISLVRPDQLQLEIHQTVVGCIPILLAGCRADFESLLRCFLHRNEPHPIPGSQGAAMIAGYNNWNRIQKLRRTWEAENPGASETDWKTRFQEIVPLKQLYQDRFIILSNGPYGGAVVPEEKAALSVVIRREHECAHYMTRRIFGSMRNNLHDELIADYSGIVTATGFFRTDWFLRFMGLENEKSRTDAARFEIYVQDPSLSDGSRQLLRVVVRRAAENLAEFDQLQGEPENAARRMLVAMALASCTLDELASEQGIEILRDRYEDVRQRFKW